MLQICDIFVEIEINKIAKFVEHLNEMMNCFCFLFSSVYIYIALNLLYCLLFLIEKCQYFGNYFHVSCEKNPMLVNRKCTHYAWSIFKARI